MKDFSVMGEFLFLSPDIDFPPHCIFCGQSSNLIKIEGKIRTVPLKNTKTTKEDFVKLRQVLLFMKLFIGLILLLFGISGFTFLLMIPGLPFIFSLLKDTISLNYCLCHKHYLRRNLLKNLIYFLLLLGIVCYMLVHYNYRIISNLELTGFCLIFSSLICNLLFNKKYINPLRVVEESEDNKLVIYGANKNFFKNLG